MRERVQWLLKPKYYWVTPPQIRSKEHIDLSQLQQHIQISKSFSYDYNFPTKICINFKGNEVNENICASSKLNLFFNSKHFLLLIAVLFIWCLKHNTYNNVKTGFLKSRFTNILQNIASVICSCEILIVSASGYSFSFFFSLATGLGPWKISQNLLEAFRWVS